MASLLATFGPRAPLSHRLLASLAWLEPGRSTLQPPQGAVLVPTLLADAHATPPGPAAAESADTIKGSPLDLHAGEPGQELFLLLLGLLECRLLLADGPERLRAMSRGSAEAITWLAEHAGSHARLLECLLEGGNRARALQSGLSQAAEAMARAELPPPGGLPQDRLGPLYAALRSRGGRHAHGEHYTPGWVVQRVLAQLDWPGETALDGPPALLEPACGSGIFLLHALEALWRRSPRASAADLLERVRGMELLPAAVRAAKLNLRIYLGKDATLDILRRTVVQADALQLSRPSPPLAHPFAWVVGNPPWVSWESLPDRLRVAARGLWEQEGLFSPGGWRVRMGAGKKDLSMLFVALAGSRWLGQEGRLGMVLPRSLGLSAAAEGLRRRLGQGPLRLTGVEDLGTLAGFRPPMPTLLLYARQDEKSSDDKPFWIGWSHLPPDSPLFPSGHASPLSPPMAPVSDAEPPARLAGGGDEGDTRDLPSAEAPDPTSPPECFAAGGSSRLSEDLSLADVMRLTRRQVRPLQEETSSRAWVPAREGPREDAKARVLGRSGPGEPLSSGATVSGWQAREGANTGGANGIFWLEVLTQAPGEGGLASTSAREVERRPEGLPGLGQPASASVGAKVQLSLPLRRRVDRTGLLRVRNLAGLGRLAVPVVEGVLEAAFVRPLLRGRDVTRWLATPTAHILLVQDPALRRGLAQDRLALEGPRTLAWLEGFRGSLEARPLYRKFFDPTVAPFYSIYNVGPYTLAPWKVVWRELSTTLLAAVVGPGPEGVVIPDHKLMLVACSSQREAHFLCAVLNAPVSTRLARERCLSTSLGPHLLQALQIPPYDRGHKVCRALVQCSWEAHQRRGRGELDLADVEARLDGLVAALMGKDGPV